MRSTRNAQVSRDQVREILRDAGIELRLQDAITEDLKNAFFETAADDAGRQLQAIGRRLLLYKRSDKTHHADGSGVTTQEKQEASAKNAIRYGIGNCGECAALAFTMFAEYPGPEGNIALPGLDGTVNARSRIEKVSATKGDHAFVVVNRNASVDIKNPGAWMTGETILCDTWWFHTGKAMYANDSGHPDQKDLIDFNTENADNLKVNLAIRLGRDIPPVSGGKAKYNSLNYYANSVSETKALLGAA